MKIQKSKSIKSLFLITMVVFCASTGLFAVHIGVAEAAMSSGWESEADLVRIGDDDKWSICAYAFPHIAYNLRGDGKWVLISNRESTDQYYGYYYNSTTGKWVEDSSLVTGLVSQGWRDYPVFAYNVTGDGKWTLISHQGSSFYGYYWNGTQWVEDSSRVNGISNFDVGAWWKTSHTFIEDLTGDGKWTLLTGMGDGTFRAFCWDGTQWTEDSLRVNGLPSIGGNSRVTAGFNVFGENKWNLIATNVSSKSFRGFCWDGIQWIENTTKVVGLTTDLPELVPTLGYNVTGNGKWVLISGVGQLYTLLGFFYNSVDTDSLLSQIDVTSYHTLATTARITFSYTNTWNHRVKYSTNSDMTGALWSDWFEDMDNADVKLTHLNPNTTYYYEVYTYIPWDTSYYVKSSVKSFNTLSAQNPITVNPGDSIQDAIEMLPLTGGTVNLASGTHNVNDTIVIYMDNITIQGTHSSEIRSHNPNKDVFVIPHENPSAGEDWANMPVLENFVFKGFKVTSSYTSRGKSLINAWNVKNLVVEDILDESYISYLAIINPAQGSTVHSEDIYISNNILTRSCISFRHSTNIHVINNRLINTAISAAINIGRNNSYIYIYDNYVNGGTNYCIRGHGGNYVWIENNTLFSAQIGIHNDALSYATISNNTITDCSYAAMTIDPQFPRKDVKIINNRIYNNPGDGIMTTIHGGFKEEVSDIDIINNVIYNNGGNGIEMRQEWVQMDIKNNIITNNEGYGINYIETQGPTIHSYNYFYNNAQGNFNGTTAGVGDIEAVVEPKFADVTNEDFYLKSTTGRWTDAGWVVDSDHSLCIDAGDPIDDYNNEPSSNGNRINMGAYGNTIYASKSSGGASDTTPPTGSIQINSGNQKTNSQNVSLTISANDESGLSEMKISNSNDFNSVVSQAYSTIKSFILSTGDGLKTIYIWFKDSIGNWNITPYSDTIILDSTGPTISNISVSNITTSTASISFATNEPTTSHIEYGTSAAYGFSSSAEASADKQTHSVNLTGLSSDTTYHFKIISRDELENESNSTDQTFKTIGNPDTIPPAKITDLSSSNITQTSADLLWTAKGDDGNNGTSANYDLRYSQSDPSGLAGQALQDWWDNSTQLTGEPIPSSSGTEEYISVGLSSNTNYYFIIKSSDEVPNWSDYSNILSLKTLAVSIPPSSGGGTVSDTTPPSQPSSFKAIPADAQITLNWKNPSDSDFVRVTILRISADPTLILTQKNAEELFKGCPLNCQNQNIVVIYEGNKEQYTDINLNNNTTYYYSIFAYDKKPNYSKILTISSKPIEGKTSIEISNGSSYPEGTLLKTPNSFKIYIIINQKKKWIPTPEVFETLGYQWTEITIIEKNQLILIPDYEDNLIRAINDFKVYLIVNGIKRHIPNPEIFINYGFEWNEVKDVNQETINQYTQANLIKESKKEKVYYLCPTRKIKRWLRSPEIFNSYPDNNWNNIQVISKYEMDHYPTSNLIKLNNDNDVYLIEGNKKRLINSVEEFKREGLDWNLIMGVGGVEWGWFKG